MKGHATKIMPVPDGSGGVIPMVNEYVMVCPECRMSYSMNSVLSKADNSYTCPANPSHKFKMGDDGFLKSF